MSIQPSNTSSSDKVPELRFPEFEGEWETSKIEGISNVSSGGTPNRSNLKYWGGDIPWITTSLIDFNKIIEAEEYITEEGLNASSAKLFPKGTILMAMYGQGKTRGKVGVLGIEAATNQACAALKLNNNFIIDFVFNYLAKDYDKIRKIANDGGQQNLSIGLIKSLKIAFPTLPEQQKIASFLTAIDQRIQLLQQKKANLEEYKKGVMQKLFTQEIRFKIEGPDGDLVEPPDWEEKRLGEVLFEHKKKNKGNLFDEVFSVSKEKGVINQIEHLGRSYSADSIEHYKLINPFDIVYTKSPTSDFPFGIIKQNLTERTGVLSPLYAVFQPKNKWVGFILHSYFLSWVNTYNYLVPLVHRGAKNTMNINNNDFLKGSKISLPTSEAEQQKIASFLSSIDKSISIVQKEIDGMTTFKKGLLQKMFV